MGRSIFYVKMACGRLIFFFLDSQTVFFFEKIERWSLDTEHRVGRVSHASPTRISHSLQYHSPFSLSV